VEHHKFKGHVTPNEDEFHKSARLKGMYISTRTFRPYT